MAAHLVLNSWKSRAYENIQTLKAQTNQYIHADWSYPLHIRSDQTLQKYAKILVFVVQIVHFVPSFVYCILRLAPVSSD